MPSATLRITHYMVLFFFEGPLPIGVAQRAIWRHLIAYQLFDLFDIGKTPLRRARPDCRIIHQHFEDSTSARHQGYLAKLSLKRCQEFLCIPSRSQKPTALCAIVNLHAWLMYHFVSFLGLVNCVNYVIGLAAPAGATCSQGGLSAIICA